ncbi:hypothetical protein C0J52_11591 [Blattella germanica]|nr:hypothetical protein C0J52_11591 [Blattella germanica]
MLTPKLRRFSHFFSSLPSKHNISAWLTGPSVDYSGAGFDIGYLGGCGGNAVQSTFHSLTDCHNPFSQY